MRDKAYTPIDCYTEWFCLPINETDIYKMYVVETYSNGKEYNVMTSIFSCFCFPRGII